MEPQIRDEARELNSEGVRLHGRRNYTESLARFERAVALNPNYGIARFNAACAAARLDDVDGARAHAEAFLLLAPGSAGKLLHDEDLHALRSAPGFDAWLTEKVRSSDGAVRSLVFERREDGGDLFVIAEDGLGERALANDSEWREYRAAITEDGTTVVLRRSREMTRVC